MNVVDGINFTGASNADFSFTYDADAGAPDAGAAQTPGHLALTWTVNDGGANCPVDGGTVNFSGQRSPDAVPVPADASVDCTTYGYTFTDLPPGSWTFMWSLMSPGNADVQGALSAVTVPEGGYADAGFDITPCAHCIP